ncbi:MAG TPA: response regulator transcription factor [Actinomycetota bacterium]|nr:response regulator transcription factor [Actinomycetota bacterium]
MTVRVMIVDDTDHVREMLASMLELDGFDVVGKASSGPEAIAMVAAADPHIVVMDYKMPGQDGLTTTRRIRSTHPDVPVILYTAYLDDLLQAEARDAGVSVCVGKVEGLETLEREISALCLGVIEGQPA